MKSESLDRKKQRTADRRSLPTAALAVAVVAACLGFTGCSGSSSNGAAARPHRERVRDPLARGGTFPSPTTSTPRAGNAQLFQQLSGTADGAIAQLVAARSSLASPVRASRLEALTMSPSIAIELAVNSMQAAHWPDRVAAAIAAATAAYQTVETDLVDAKNQTDTSIAAWVNRLTADETKARTAAATARARFG